MDTQLKKGVMELCVLSLLAHRDFYGYELVSEISKAIEISEGTIYPLLRRMRDDGQVKTYLQESTEGPPRKYYTLTDRGRSVSVDLEQDWKGFVRSVNRILEGK